ncbi:YhgE/Pip domain-containing protein [Lactococcus lactis]|uniref:YhgE/Pip domain-containing protein n=1 Tax=Lactococcus lactis TaxID=1358 RepID=A0ABD5GRN3_9LACT|nr:YhgE/Pip domain-containing protein [Lactococcus lactis]MDQ7159914.1 YhgE/Pip domain-containing protein [Lactococcus lactis]MDV2619726.1 YhgE/Pip domain-containing protein [Lactococcus lactis]PFG86593.1 ABC transporter [Lactococcus lactis]WNN67365.1 YhgE/Pip domain-containing protein [Lactococcus lactis]WPK09888.1 YhgE/Pip domain-containing protein [Lactococcus lactis]
MLKKEWQAILKHKFFIIVIIALALVPAIYNYIFLGSMWDPYGKLNDLPVAVVNLDKTSELNGKKFKLGDDVIAEMKKSKDLDYHFVSEDKASKGIKKGDYYMVITFPENFSENATTLMNKKPKTVQLDYQTTRGHNYISSKMSESAMNQLKSEVSKNITETYTKEIFAKLGDMKSGMKEASDGSNKLADGTSSALNGSKELSSNLNTLSSSSLTFTDGANNLNSGLNKYVSGVNQAANGGQQLSSGADQFVSGTQQLAAGTQTLADKSKELSAGLTELTQKTALSAEQQAQISQLQNGLTDLNNAIQNGAKDTGSADSVKNDLASVKKSLEDTQTILSDIVPNQIKAMAQTKAYNSLKTDQQNELNAAILNSAQSTLSPIQTSMTSVADSLTDVGNQLMGIQNQTKELAQNSNVALPGANAIISQLSTGLSDVNSALANQVTPGFAQYADGVNQANAGAQQLASKSKDLQSGTMQLVSGLSQLQANGSTLTSGSNQLAGGAQQISSGSQQLANGGSSLTSGLGTLNTGANNLSTALTKADDTLSATNNSNENAKKVAAPLKLKHTDHDNVPENGAGMTPYMINVALFIGALATNVVIGIGFSGEKWKSGREFMLAKIGTNGLVALLQGIIVWGAVALLGLRPNHLWEMLLSVLLISFAYMAINTFFLTALGKIGEFLMIVVLVLQLATSAGTYPLQLAPKIYQVISPWLPMTYGLKMLRETIGLNGAILPEAILFVVIIALFTFMLSFFKKFSRFA